MIEVSLHAKERLVERVLDKKFNEKELKTYVSKHNTKLTLRIIELFEGARFLWQGNIEGKNGNQHDDAKFYINDDIIFVTDTGDQKIKTLYKVEIPFPQPLIKSVISKGVSSIESLRRKRNKYTDNWRAWLIKKRKERDQVQESIAKLNLRHTKKIQQLQSRQTVLENQLYNKEKVIKGYDENIEQYARILCNSLQLKQEIEKGLKL